MNNEAPHTTSILLVADEGESQALMDIIKSAVDHPFEASVVTNGEDALDALRDGCHDICLIDGRLREGNDARFPRILLIQREDESRIAAERNANQDHPEERLRRMIQRAFARRSAQDRIALQDRLDALGRMAKRLSHDFGNSLSPILGLSDLLLSNPDPYRDRRQVERFLKMIHRAATEALMIVNRMRQFYRPLSGTSVHGPIDLKSLVESAIAAARSHDDWAARAANSAIRFRVELDGVPPLMGDRAELETVFKNLILNADDAMPDGGTIRVNARSEPDVAFVTIEDGGGGMSPDTKRHCLEPFFTTKDDLGAGLGLSEAYGVMARHGGDFFINSEVGRGTTITLRFPLWSDEAQSAQRTTLSRMTDGLQVEDQLDGATATKG